MYYTILRVQRGSKSNGGSLPHELPHIHQMTVRAPSVMRSLPTLPLPSALREPLRRDYTDYRGPEYYQQQWGCESDPTTTVLSRRYALPIVLCAAGMSDERPWPPRCCTLTLGSYPQRVCASHKSSSLGVSVPARWNDR